MREGSKLKYQWSSICVLQKQQKVDADLVLQGAPMWSKV